MKSSFTIIEDSKPGGQLLELGVLGSLPFPIAVLRNKNSNSSWMVDPLMENKNFRKVFYYDLKKDPLTLIKAVGQSFTWARNIIVDKAQHLNLTYPWRDVDFKLWNEFGDVDR